MRQGAFPSAPFFVSTVPRLTKQLFHIRIKYLQNDIHIRFALADIFFQHQMLGEMALDHFPHQSVHGTTNGGNLLQYLLTFMIFLQHFLQAIHLAFYSQCDIVGALHGLEPSHSKTMMAAFIVAVKGSVRQAVMLGLAATLSHTAIVWLIAVGGMYTSQKFTAEAAEPWTQLVSGVIILSTGIWMFWRTRRDEQRWQRAQSHAQDWKTRVVDTGHGHVALSIADGEGHQRFK
jgi:hypothetical protein